MSNVQEFFVISVQLLKMTNADTQYYLNYLSARLRVMCFLFFRYKWDKSREQDYLWFSKQIIQEVVCPK